MTATASARNRRRLTQADFRQLMSCWSTGVAVVTSAAGCEPVGCTVSAITSVSLEPPSLLVSLAAGGRTLAAIEQSGRLGVNLLPARCVDIATRFSRGDQAARFANVAYAWVENVPVLEEVVTAAVCETARLVPVADHVLVVAEPMWWYRSSQRHPLVCFDRSYWSLWSMGVVGEQ